VPVKRENVDRGGWGATLSIFWTDGCRREDGFRCSDRAASDVIHLAARGRVARGHTEPGRTERGRADAG
jgi:hypothetical protein